MDGSITESSDCQLELIMQIIEMKQFKRILDMEDPASMPMLFVSYLHIEEVYSVEFQEAMTRTLNIDLCWNCEGENSTTKSLAIIM